MRAAKRNSHCKHAKSRAAGGRAGAGAVVGLAALGPRTVQALLLPGLQPYLATLLPLLERVRVQPGF